MNSGKIERVEEMPVFQRFYAWAAEIEKATRGFEPDLPAAGLVVLDD